MDLLIKPTHNLSRLNYWNLLLFAIEHEFIRLQPPYVRHMPYVPHVSHVPRVQREEECVMRATNHLTHVISI